MLMLLYSLALVLVLVLSAPWWLLRMLTTERYREGLSQRLGRVPEPLRVRVRGKRIVWIHAVSVGEVLAVTSLLAELQSALGPRWQVVLSTTTRTGQQLARKRFGATYVFYFPIDFGFAVRAWLRALRPELLILTESELWPRLLHECARSGIPVAVVNARVSDRSFRRSQRVKSLWCWMTRHVTLWLAQSEEDAARLLELGASPDRVRVGGNLKYDTRVPHDTPLTAIISSGAAGRPMVLAGSTVHYGTTPEESIVLEAMRAHVWPELPNALLVLAPRHPQRFVETGVLAAHFGTMICATDLPITAPGYRIQERIVVLDTIGDLAALYRSADVAFIGGSLVPHGGHNPLEPAQFGVPVVMGPSFTNFRDIVARLLQAGAIRILPDSEVGTLGRALLGLLSDLSGAQALGARGRAVFEQQQGATARTVRALLPLIREVHQLAAREQAIDEQATEEPTSEAVPS